MSYSGRSRSRSPKRDAPPREGGGGGSEDGCKLYIGNLSFQTQAQDLRDYFSTVKKSFSPLDRDVPSLQILIALANSLVKLRMLK
jgi:hypothetical protein